MMKGVDAVSSRLEMIRIARDFVRDVLKTSPEQLLPCLYLCINKLGPDHFNNELGVGDSLLIKALGQATGRVASKIKDAFTECGDLGEVAMTSRGGQKMLAFGAKPKPLLVTDVFKFLTEIANCKGNSSQQLRVDIIKKMLVRAVDAEPMFIIRHCQGKLRIGMAESTLLVAVAQAFAMTPIGDDGKGHDKKFKSSDERAEIFEVAVSRTSTGHGEPARLDR